MLKKKIIAKRKVTPKRKTVKYSDIEIRRKSDGRRFYIRVKVGRGSFVTLSVKTHKEGRGLPLAKYSFTLEDENSMKKGITRLCKRFGKFYIVKLFPAWEE
jgi:hypothetical protein